MSERVSIGYLQTLIEKLKSNFQSTVRGDVGNGIFK